MNVCRGSDPMGEDHTHLRAFDASAALARFEAGVREDERSRAADTVPASVWRNIAERHENELRDLREQLMEAFGTDDVAAIARGFDKGARALSGADTPATKDDS